MRINVKENNKNYWWIKQIKCMKEICLQKCLKC